METGLKFRGMTGVHDVVLRFEVAAEQEMSEIQSWSKETPCRKWFLIFFLLLGYYYYYYYYYYYTVGSKDP